MNIMKALRMQCAADDIFTLADMVAELSRFLDQIAKDHDHPGEFPLSERVNAAFPIAREIGPKSNEGLLALAWSLTPPDEE